MMMRVLPLSTVPDSRTHFHVVKCQMHLATDCSNLNRFDCGALWNRFGLWPAIQGPPQRPIHSIAQNTIQFVAYLLTNDVVYNSHELYRNRPFVSWLLPALPVLAVDAERLHLSYWNAPVLDLHDGTMVKKHRRRAQIEMMMASLQMYERQMEWQNNMSKCAWKQKEKSQKTKRIFTKGCSRCP